MLYNLRVIFVPTKRLIQISENKNEDEVDYGVQPAAVANEFEFLRNFMTLNEKERILIGHDFGSFIKRCNFRGKDCLIER